MLASEAARTGRQSRAQGERERIYLTSGVGGAVGGPGLQPRGIGKGGWPGISHMAWAAGI